MPAGYDDPGPAPENVLPKVVAKLRSTLKDPYSIRDFTMCELRPSGAYYASAWVRANWIVQITLNAKNSFGGYMGATLFTITFENGEAAKVSQFEGLTLISAAQNAKIVEAAQACPRVSDAEIQRLMNAAP